MPPPRRPSSPSALRDSVRKGLVTPAATGPGEPPPSAPIARLEEIVAERGERHDLPDDEK